ncbi:MAG: phage tail tape measure protein [Oscillospiraceae bacterium]|nr:phage tail tape measure protein [Oscillospiraceae bacterium]
MSDGSLIFDTGLDNSGFTLGISKLKTAAVGAAAAVTAAFTAASVAAVNVGSSFTAAMSQVSATMGITRMSKDYDILAASAEEMGAKTKFSATQAAEALNYLALAGYDANKAVASLPTVLDVAAAGGIDLAYSSDMITDSMSALGLSVDELESFADKLAKTSQKSNTSVAQLGEAILTVGGTAKTLSGGVTELNTMLGLIADNGIKGAEGGTALRNIILSLSAPTDIAAEALARLNVNAFDGAGKMRALSDVFADLNTALAPLTDQQKTQALNEIFNKVDLKAVNALLGTSSERFAELTGYIDNCEGAAAQMAKTMSDNLTSDMDAFSSALEGLGITAFDKFEQPMRTAVQSVTDLIGKLDEKLKGDTGDKLTELAERFGDISVRGAELAIDKGIPKLINALEWICDHDGQLITAAETAATMVIAYKGFSAANTAASAVTSLGAAMSGAATTAEALGIAMNTVPWVAVGSLIIGCEIALASYIDRQKELIGVETEHTIELEKQNEEYRKQLGYLYEVKNSNPLEAYNTSKDNYPDVVVSYAKTSKEYEELRSKIASGGYTTEGGGFHIWTKAEADQMNSELMSLEIQKNHLFQLKREMHGIIASNDDMYGTGLSQNTDDAAAKRAEEKAKEHFGVLEQTNSDIIVSQEELNKALADGWDELEHKYATGIISNESELYSKQLELLAEYGDENCKEHWKYYEQIYSYQMKYAEECKRIEKESAEKTLENEKERYRNQLSITTTSINSLLDVYKNKMRELESNITSYKSKLLSVGNVLSVNEYTDNDGKMTREYTVENIKDQMAQMRKYHEYVKELKTSGASEGLISELTSMNFTDGVQFGKYLTSLSSTEFLQIDKLYKEREALAEQLSQDLYAGEAEKINNAMLTAVDSAILQLPKQTQAAGRQFLSDFIYGIDLSVEDISDEVSSFVSSFTELFNSVLEDFDLAHGFSIALGGMNTYSMGQDLARDLAAGFNAEIERGISEIKISQANAGVYFGNSYKSNAAPSTGYKPTNDNIQLNANITTDVILDYEKVGRAVYNYIEQVQRRKG